MRITMQLAPKWARFEQNQGPDTYYRESIETSGALQVSSQPFPMGTVPGDSTEFLAEMAKGFGPRMGLFNVIESSSGNCAFGNWGSAVFRSEKLARFQVWFVCNGRDVIMATHICGDSPDSIEVAEAQSIVESLGLESH